MDMAVSIPAGTSRAPLSRAGDPATTFGGGGGLGPSGWSVLENGDRAAGGDRLAAGRGGRDRDAERRAGGGGRGGGVTGAARAAVLAEDGAQHAEAVPE